MKVVMKIQENAESRKIARILAHNADRTGIITFLDRNNELSIVQVSCAELTDDMVTFTLANGVQGERLYRSARYSHSLDFGVNTEADDAGLDGKAWRLLPLVYTDFQS